MYAFMRMRYSQARTFVPSLKVWNERQARRKVSCRRSSARVRFRVMRRAAPNRPSRCSPTSTSNRSRSSALAGGLDCTVTSAPILDSLSNERGSDEIPATPRSPLRSLLEIHNTLERHYRVSVGRHRSDGTAFHQEATIARYSDYKPAFYDHLREKAL